MAKVFGGEASLMGQVAHLSGQDGWNQLHWQRFCASQEWREQIRQVLDGEAEIVPTAIKTPRQPSAKQQIVRFYTDVFGLGQEATAALKRKSLKAEGNLNTFMLNLGTLLPKDIMAAICQKWDMPDPYLYRSLADIDLATAQKRPSGSYVFCHAGTDEPDQLGKSYDDAIGEGMTFLNPTEYLLATAFHKWSKGYFMDRKGWTRTSSLWCDGGLVNVNWNDNRLNVNNGNRDNRNSNNGPRSEVLAETHFFRRVSFLLYGV